MHTAEHRVGIFLSGGMDSALLLYLVAQKTPSCIQPFTVPKHDGAATYVQPIIDWVVNKTNSCIHSPVVLGNPDLPHEMILGDAINRVVRHNLCDSFYIGDNSYPEDELPGGPKRVQMKSERAIYPFFHLTKIDILKLYMEHDVMDLLPLTHTCTERAIGRCRQCWQCRERAWAFRKCGIQDLTST